MSKRHRHQEGKRFPRTPAAASPGEQRARVESLLASGKTREAVEAAKQCLKATPGAL